MELEFLDLIKTFEKAVNRLETLDRTMLTFNEVVNGLRQNLDELVELVHLEEIVELSEKGSQKIQKLHQSLEQGLKSYERVLTVDAFQDACLERLQTIETHLTTYSMHEEKSEKPVLHYVSTKALEDSQFIYYIEEKTHQLIVVAKDAEMIPQRVEGIQAKKLVYENNMVFVLQEETGEVYTLKGSNLITAYVLKATDFFVRGYYLYYLTNQQLMKLHLLTSTKELILADVRSCECLNQHILCQTETNEMKLIPLYD